MKTIQGRLGLPKRLGIAAAVFLICVLSTSAQLRALQEASNPSEPGTFYLQSDRDENPVPWPFNPYPPDVVPVFAIDAANNIFLVADSPEAFSALQQKKQMSTALSSGGMMTLDESDLGLPGPGGDTNGYGGYTNNFVSCPFDTNALWLELAHTAPGLASVNLHNATNQVYGIWGSTDLQTWNVETDLWPTNAGVMPFAIPMLDRPNFFVRAQDWTDIWTNGLPMWYLWRNFGSDWMSQTADSDYDQDGMSNLQEYEAGTEPNDIGWRVSFANQYVTVNPARVQLTVESGAPSSIAVLVDSTNFTSATWTAYDGGDALAELGTEGWHDVWIGLRGRLSTSRPTWHPAPRIKLDLTPPVLVIINPTSFTVSQPVIQLQGTCTEPLASFTYDLSNSNGIATNQLVTISGQDHNTNTWDATTLYFQAFDLPLVEGTNLVTLHATDLAGNTTVTNLLLSLDYSSKTNPPSLQLAYPQDGAQIGGSNFLCRGWVSDPTAQVSAQIVDANGVTNSATARVDRQGDFWIENVPISDGANSLTVTVVDGVGNANSTNVAVAKSEVTLTIDPGVAQNWTSGNVSGTISDPSYEVWVNGVQGTNNGDGTWSAQVPLTLDNSFVEVQAVAGSGGFQMSRNGMLAEQSNDAGSGPPVTVQMALTIPAVVFMNFRHDTLEDVRGTYYFDHRRFMWGEGGGNEFRDYMQYMEVWPGMWAWIEYEYLDVWGAGQWPSFGDGIHNQLLPTNDPQVGHPSPIAGPSTGTEYDFGALYYNFDPDSVWQYTSQAEMVFVAGGKPGSTASSLYQLNAAALAWWYNKQGIDAAFVDNEMISLGNLGHCDSEGNVYLVAADNTRTMVTPQVNGVPMSERNVDVIAKYVPYITANGIDLRNNTPEFCVGQRVTTQVIFSPPLPSGASVRYEWDYSGEYKNERVDTGDIGVSPKYVINSDILNSNTPSLWWYNGGGPEMVSCKCTIAIQDQTATIPVHGYVHVYRPSLSGFTNREPRGFVTGEIDDTFSLCYGDPVMGDSNLTWNVNINSKYDGRKGVTQFIKGKWSTKPGDLGMDCLSAGCLDTSEFYDPTERYEVTNLATHIVELADGPAVGIGMVGAELSIPSVQDYVRFKPGLTDNDGNIYVTLGIIHWSAHGAYYHGIGITINDTPAASPPDSSDDFPTWECIIPGDLTPL